MKQTGWRKLTPGLGVAEQHAQAGEQEDIPKTRAMVAVKRIAAHLGLKPGDMLLLDTLGAFSQPQDWTAGSRPVVWPSNACLMVQTGFSRSALKRHLRRLSEAGLVAFRDSPNGKRWGRRDALGEITEAYGIDLSPIAARTQEFECLARQLQQEREQYQRIKRQITIARRTIRARLDSLATSNLPECLAQRFAELLAQLPRRIIPLRSLEHLLLGFMRLAEQISSHLSKAGENTATNHEEPSQETTQTAPKGSKNEPHIQTTKQLKPVESSQPEQGNPQSEKAPQNPLSRLLHACPEFTEWGHRIGGYLKSWADAQRIAAELGPMIGLSQEAWTLAQEKLGQVEATTAFAILFDKHCAGEVRSVTAYLAGMVAKAGYGALHLDRSIHGRLAAREAQNGL